MTREKLFLVYRKLYFVFIKIFLRTCGIKEVCSLRNGLNKAKIVFAISDFYVYNNQQTRYLRVT